MQLVLFFNIVSFSLHRFLSASFCDIAEAIIILYWVRKIEKQIWESLSKKISIRFVVTLEKQKAKQRMLLSRAIVLILFPSFIEMS